MREEAPHGSEGPEVGELVLTEDGSIFVIRAFAYRAFRADLQTGAEGAAPESLRGTVDQLRWNARIGAWRFAVS